MALVEDFFDFFQRTSHCFGVHEKDMEEGGKVECAKDEVGFPGDGAETGWNGECESGVKGPVGRLVEREKGDDRYCDVGYWGGGMIEGLTVASDTAFPRTFREYCNVIGSVRAYYLLMSASKG